MAVVFNTFTTAQVGGTPQATLSWSHTVGAGSNKVLIVALGCRGFTSIASGITYNSVALTKRNTYTFGSESIEFWYLVNPSEGAFNIVVSFVASSRSQVTAVGASYFGASQASPISNIATNNNSSSASISVGITPQSSGSLIMDYVGAQRGATFTRTAGAGQTKMHDSFNVNWGSASSRKTPTTGSETMSWTFDNTTNVAGIVAVEIASGEKSFTTDGIVTQFDLEVLVIGGGGGGGYGTTSRGAGGGGAGGYRYESWLPITTGCYSVVVGTGGSGGSSGSQIGGNGSNSSFSTVTAIGGGGGGGGEAGISGNSGGSGGGGAGNSGSGGAGTGVQGNNGGNGGSGTDSGGGGGGGSGAVGSNGSANGGNGGTGTSNSISGSSVTYAGGAGGGSRETAGGTGGTGGSGGGGNGATTNTVPATAGTANTGGGGGGGSGSGGATYGNGKNGGSGIVIIRYATADLAGFIVTGGTITTDGGDTIHTFTASGTFIIASTVDETFTTDGLIVNQETETFTTDGVVVVIVDYLITTDGIVKEVLDYTFTTDAFIKLVFDQQFTTDAEINYLSAPDLTFHSAVSPYSFLTSLVYKQSKTGAPHDFPVLIGEVSDNVLFRIYNNFAQNPAIADAINIEITSYDNASEVSRTCTLLPVSQSWVHIMQNGFGEGSSGGGLLTFFEGTDTAVGGCPPGFNLYRPEQGSDGSQLNKIRAGSDGNGMGFVELKSYARVSPDAPNDSYMFVITVHYDYVV